MTISSENNQIAYNGNGTTTNFSFPYAFQSESDLVVIETVKASGVQTTKALTTDYTVSGTTDGQGFYPNGGTVTANTAPANTVTWTIFNDPAATQLLDLVENDPLPAEALEAALDRLTMLVQRVKKVVQRSLHQPDGDTTDIRTLPSAVERASKFLAFDADGNAVASDAPEGGNVVSTFMAGMLDDVDATAARTTIDAEKKFASMSDSELTGILTQLADVMPSFRVHRGGTDQNAIATATYTKLQFTTEEWDNGDSFDNVTNYRFQPTVAGEYFFYFTVRVSSLVDQQAVLAAVYKNGSLYAEDIDKASGTNVVSPSVVTSIRLNGSTDYVEFYVYQDAGVAKNVAGTTAYTFAGGHWVRP
jgi:hypothetical protein